MRSKKQIQDAIGGHMARSSKEILEAAAAISIIGGYAHTQEPDATTPKWEAVNRLALALEWASGEDNSFGSMLEQLQQVAVRYNSDGKPN